MEKGEVIAENLHSPQFRTIANQKPELSPKVRAIIDLVERQRSVYISLVEELWETEIPAFDPPTLQINNIPRSAAIVRQWLQLQEKNSFETYRRAIESKAVLVFRTNGYSGAWQIPKDDPICGFTLHHEIYPVIVVKKEATETRQVFTLVHELGHLLLHQNSFIDEEEDLFSTEGKEAQANSFAGHVLVPDALLNQIDLTNRPADERDFDHWLRPYRETWGVSGEVILRRLLNVGILEQQEYQKYRQWRKTLSLPEAEGGSRQYRYREPKHIFGEPFVQTVLDALHAKQISLSRASTYLDNLKISDVHQLEGYYAGL